MHLPLPNVLLLWVSEEARQLTAGRTKRAESPLPFGEFEAWAGDRPRERHIYLAMLCHGCFHDRAAYTLKLIEAAVLVGYVALCNRHQHSTAPLDATILDGRTPSHVCIATDTPAAAPAVAVTVPEVLLHGCADCCAATSAALRSPRLLQRHRPSHQTRSACHTCLPLH